MSNKRTPGPWKYSDDKLMAIANTDGSSFVAWTPEITDAIGTRIAQISMFTNLHQGKRLHVDNLHEAKANMLLMTASPDLLAFAQMVADGGWDMADLMEQAREVIAKATGE